MAYAILHVLPLVHGMVYIHVYTPYHVPRAIRLSIQTTIGHPDGTYYVPSGCPIIVLCSIRMPNRCPDAQLASWMHNHMPGYVTGWGAHAGIENYMYVPSRCPTVVWMLNRPSGCPTIVWMLNRPAGCATVVWMLNWPAGCATGWPVM